MSKLTEIERITFRDDTIRLEIVEVRSPLAPPWWDVRRRFRLWRLKYYVHNDRRKLSEEAQSALAWAEEALARDLMFGKDW